MPGVKKTTPRAPARCANPVCGRLTYQARMGQCSNCYAYTKRTGRFRPLEVVKRFRSNDIPELHGSDMVAPVVRPCANPACHAMANRRPGSRCAPCHVYKKMRGVDRRAELVARGADPVACANPACVGRGSRTPGSRCRACLGYYREHGVDRPARLVALAIARRQP